MQATSPVTAEELLGPVQETFYRLEVWTGTAWLDLGSIGGKNYLKRFSIKLGGAGASPDPVAGAWTAEVDNDGGIFHPFHPSSSYTDLFRVGRKVRISLGAKYTGTPRLWQRLIGYMDAPAFNHASRTVTLKGQDFMKRLADTDLRQPGNYWGDSIVLSTIATTENFGPELYGHVDAVNINPEIDSMDGWTAEDPTRLTSEEDSGGGSVYVGVLSKASGVYSHTAYIEGTGSGIGSVTQGKRYKAKFKYRITSGSVDTEFRFGIYEPGTSNQMLNLSGLKSWEWIEVIAYFTATKSGSMRIQTAAFDISTAGCEVRWDVVSIREVQSYSNTRYPLPAECNGVYLAVLDGTPIWYGQEEDGWLYDEENKVFYFVDTKMIEAGTDNLVLYYYTDQDLDDVLADVLVAAGYYADRAAALAAMDYEPTGITLGRVWFEAGTKALAAVKLICERAGYRFWFAFDGTPCFKPAPTATSPVFTFTSPKHVQDPGVHQDLAEIRNRIVIEGIEQAMYGTREDRQSSRLSGEASEELDPDELEKTHSIKNHLFQDQLSIDAMAAALLAAFKDPKWYAEPKTPFNPVPLELGDTIAWPMELAAAAEPGGEPTVVELTGIVRDIEIDLGQVTYKCEVVPSGGEMLAHALLSATHPDTEEAAPQLGDMVLASGEGAAPAAAGSPEHELLSEMHEDTVAAAPVAADVIMASGDPVLWRRLPVGSGGQVLKVVDGTPAWAEESGGGETHDLESHRDVLVEGKQEGDILAWNNASEKWLNPKGQSAGTIAGISYVSSFNANAYQGICSDGTYIYSTSTTVLSKYDKNGQLIDFVNVANLTPECPHAGDLCYFDGSVYICMSNYPDQPAIGKILKIRTSDLANQGTIALEGNHSCSTVARRSGDGSFWVMSYSHLNPCKVFQYNSAWEFIASYDLETVDENGEFGYDGMEWAGNYLYANIHETASLGSYLDVYRFASPNFTRVQRVSNTINGVQCGQGIGWDPAESGVLWWAARGDNNKAYKTIVESGLAFDLFSLSFRGDNVGLGTSTPAEKLHVGGRVRIDTAPSNAADAARKQEIDDHAALTNPHSSTPDATASRIILRDASGRAKVAAPSADTDIANKGYVDGMSGASAFTELSDVPAGYTDQGGKLVKVKADETGLEFVAGSGGGAEEFVDLLDVPASYSGQGGKAVKVKVDETGLEFVTAGGGGGAENFIELGDVPGSYSGQGGKLVRVKADVAGLEFESSEEIAAFLDEFADSSIHWAWTQQAGGGSIAESGSVITLSGAQDSNCRLWNAVNNAPKILTGIPGYPCEIIAKLNSFTVNNGVIAGVFVGWAMNYSNPYGLLLAHKKTAGGTSEGILIHKLTGSTGCTAGDIVPVTTLPIWLKIRINAGNARGNTITFWYSTDGLSWTQYQSGGGNYVETDYQSASYGEMMAGIVANNSADPDDSAFAAPFEFFKVVRSLGPR